jgi:hypothetical protein
MPDLITTADLASSPDTAALTTRGDVSALISTASAIVISRLGYDPTSATITETHSGTGRPRIWLARRPVASITSVTIGGTALDNTGGDAWTFEPETGRLTLGSGLDDVAFAPRFPRGDNNVVVVYVAGSSPIDARIKRACVAMSSWLAAQPSGAFTFESDTAYSYSLASLPGGRLPPVVEACLRGMQSDFVL